MLAQATRLERHTRAQFCVIGAGPAGLTLARALHDNGYKVIVLERGARRVNRRTSSHNAYESVGLRLGRPHRTRRFGFGGAGWLWSKMSVPLTPFTMAPRPWLDHSGWPFPIEELDPFYEKARSWLGVKSASPPGAQQVGSLAVQRVELSAVRFGRNEHKHGFPIYLGAVVRRLVINASGDAVEHAEVITDAGMRRVSADHFVLAAGGIENPRLMLLSDIGSDCVGRFFADHLYVNVPLSLGAGAQPPAAITKAGSNAPPAAILVLTEATCRAESCLAASGYLHPDRDPGLWDSPSVTAWRDLLWAARHREYPPQFGRVLSRAVTNPTAPARALAQRRKGVSARIGLEMAPNPESRVTLSDSKDEFGMPVARIDLRATEIEKNTLGVFLRQLADAADQQGWGPMGLPRGDAWQERLTGGFHHMGATRMHEDARFGVVDADSRVHGMKNLFVAGSSVFPSYDHANPTLTIVALAIRLAEHLAEEG